MNLWRTGRDTAARGDRIFLLGNSPEGGGDVNGLELFKSLIPDKLGAEEAAKITLSMYTEGIDYKVDEHGTIWIA